MKKLLIATAAIAALSFGAPALAANPDFPTVDSNRDGGVSLTELQVVLPDLNDSEYKAADANGDGILDEQEFGKFAFSAKEEYDPTPAPENTQSPS
jgi:hypothetical protein